MRVGWVLPVVWFGLGVVAVICSARAARSRRMYLTGVRAVSVLWVAAGAGANAYFLSRGDDYSGFADLAPTPFVRETWESVVVPQHGLFIGLLIAFEATAGALVLVAGRARQTALVLLVGFNAMLLAFGWGYLVWSVPMVVALSLLWRADRVWRRTQPRVGPPVTRIGAGR